ncbi:MAG: ExbD/TolR family protein [Flavobacteriales bacterium]
MSKFKKDDSSGSPAISTASLPDIVFMLLFFFMVTTVMREVDLKIEIKKPEAEAITKLEKKSLVDYIYIGPATMRYRSMYGTEPRIQLDDQIATQATDVGPFVIRKRTERNETDIPFVTTSLKVDEKTRMGIISRVKHELRQVDALKINYSTTRKRVQP